MIDRLRSRSAILRERVYRGVPCRVWLGSLDQKGYGQVRYRGKKWRVHVLAYVLQAGPIQAGHVVDHGCRNHSCFEFAHLEAVTQRVNTLRGESPHAQNARKTHCPLGHELVEGNIYVHPTKGGRECLKCKRERSRARAA